MRNNKENGQSQSFNLQEKLLSISNRRTEIEMLKTGINKEKGYLKNLQKEMAGDLKIVQNKIKNGEVTTGNKIEDFCLVHFAEEPEKAKQLQQIENQMKEHKGEFILFDAIVQDKKSLVWKQDLKIGVINKKTPLNTEIKTGWLVFSAKEHCYSDKHSPYGFYYSPNSLLLHKDELMFVGKSIKEVDEKKLGGVSLKIIIGDKKVYEYFNARCKSLDRLAKKLRKGLKEINLETKSSKT